MGKYFDAAYEHAMTKIASFDLDDIKDQEAYERFKTLPTQHSVIKRIVGDYDDATRFGKKLAIGSGIGAIGSGALALASKKARPYAVPAALALGTIGAGSGLGALVSAANKDAYIHASPSERREENLNDYMERHGSPYAGRRQQIEAQRQRDEDFANAMMIADAIRNRD